MKNKPLLPLFLTILLTSCSNNAAGIKSKIFCFDTYISTHLFDGKNDDLDAIENIFSKYDKLSDNYLDRNINNVYKINHTNEEVEVDQDLYLMLKKTFEIHGEGISNFHPLCGSLAKKWKEAISKKEVLDNETITSELEKMNSTTISFLDNNKIQRTGNGEIDLGGIAKGYTLDIVSSYLKENNLHQYIINAGSSSVLLGEKNNKNGFFNIGLEDVKNAYLKLKNCAVSSSSISKQSEKIDGVNYCHIINPKTGSATPVNDGVVVISSLGVYGDVLSTAMMNNTIDEIKELESKYNVKALVINDGKITYQNQGLEVLYH